MAGTFLLFHVGVSIEGAAMRSFPPGLPVTIEYSCPGRIRDTELAKTARATPRAEEEGVNITLRWEPASESKVSM